MDGLTEVILQSSVDAIETGVQKPGDCMHLRTATAAACTTCSFGYSERPVLEAYARSLTGWCGIWLEMGSLMTKRVTPTAQLLQMAEDPPARMISRQRTAPRQAVSWYYPLGASQTLETISEPRAGAQ